jgi:8-oxo-dGTP diphosphatase
MSPSQRSDPSHPTASARERSLTHASLVAFALGADDGRRRRRTPVHERSRVGRLWGGLRDYLGTAWWGLVTPRVSESEPLVIVQAAILRDGASGTEVLLSIRSDLFGWELPGGTPEVGETPEASLRREVLEETGFEVEVEGHVGDWVRQGFRPHTARVYRCRVIQGEETPSYETPRVMWWSAESPPAALFPWYREPLRCALDRAGSPVRRSDWQGIGLIWEAMKIDLHMRWHGLP